MSVPQDRIVVYSSPLCGYCAAAKRLLREKGAQFDEIDVLFHSDRRREMIELSGKRTVPQIFIHGSYVGGYAELRALQESGRLDTLLAAQTHDP